MLFAVLAIVVAAPFERPLVVVPGGFTLTTVELVTILATAGMALHLGLRRLTDRPIPLLAPGLGFLIVLAIAAAVAPSDYGNAMRFVARMAMAAALFVVTLRVIDTAARARVVVRTMLAVAAGVATIAILEAAQVPTVLSALTAFRPGFHVVAGQLRATSTLFYPTITSMYLEVAFAFGLWLLLDPSGRRPRVERAVVFGALVLIGAGITATFTRAGLFGMAAAMALVGALRLMRVPRGRAGLGTLTALASTLVVIVFTSHSPALLATRLATEGSQSWYGASYQAPATLALATGRLHRVAITVTNTGRLAWDSTKEPVFAMAYHWLRSGSDHVVQFEGARTPFARVVKPGDSITLEANVVAPGQPGAYTLVWDVVHETRSWLSTEGVRPARTDVSVTGPPAQAVVTTMERLPTATAIPSRPELWSAAFRMAVEHPWLGVGPDNFRHAYGPYLGIDQWDRRLHANNMYLEVLAGAGLAGLVAMFWLVAESGVRLWRLAHQQATEVNHVATLAALAAWAMIVGHGLVDSFLSFTTTYVTFAIGAGLALSPALADPIDADAHRV